MQVRTSAASCSSTDRSGQACDDDNAREAAVPGAIDSAHTIDYNPLSKEAKQDPETCWRELRKVDPVHHFVLPEDEMQRMSENPFAAEPTTEFWTVLRHADVAHVLTNPADFLQRARSGSGPDGPERGWRRADLC
jgi:cytochrome P450